jgi:hypothetical protein
VRRKLFGCLGFLLLLLLILLALGYSFWHQPTVMPTFLGSRLKSMMLSKLGIDLDFAQAEITVKPGKIDVASFSLALPNEKPFFSGSRARISMGKAESLWTAYTGQSPVDLIAGEQLTIDLSAPWPKSSGKTGESGKLTLPPLKRLVNDALLVKFGPWQARFTDIVVDIDRGKNAAVFHLKLGDNPLGGAGFATGTVQLEAGKSRIVLTWKDLDLAMVHQLFFLKLLYGVPDISGKVSVSLCWEGNLENRINSPLANLKELVQHEISGTIHFSEVKTSFQSLPVTVEASLQKPLNQDMKLQFDAGVASGTLHGSAHGGLMNDTMAGGEFLVNGTDLHPDEKLFALLKAEEIPLAIDRLDFSIGGSIRENTLETCSGTMILKELVFQISDSMKAASPTAEPRNAAPQKLASRNIEILWAKSLNLLTATLTAELFDGSARLAASTTWPMAPGQKIAVQGILTQIQAGPAARLMQKTCDGLINSDFSLIIPGTDYLGTEYDGNFRVQGLTYSTLAAPEFSGKFQGKGIHWQLKDLYMTFIDGSFIKFKGVLSPASNKGEFFIRDLPSHLFGLPPQTLNGKISCDGSISGEFSNVHLKGNAWSQSLFIGSQEFAPMKAQLVLRDEIVSLQSISGKIKGGGSVGGHLAIGLATRVLGDTTLTLVGIDLSILKQFDESFFATYPVTGIVSGSLEAKSHRKSPQYNFTLAGKNIIIASETVRSFQLSGNSRDGTTEVRITPLKIFDGVADFSGQYLPGAGFLASFSARDFSLDKIQHAKQALPPLSGRVSLTGNLNWSEANKAGTVDLKGKKLMISTMNLGDFFGQMRLTPTGIHVTRADLGKFGMTGSGTLGFHDQKPYDATINLAGTDLADLPEFFTRSGFHKGNVKLAGRLHVRGAALAKPPDEASCVIDKLEVRRGTDVLHSPKPLHIKYRNETFDVQAFSLELGQGVWEMSGTYKLWGAGDVKFSGKKISLQAVSSLFNKPDLGVGGTFSATGGVSGSFPDLALNGDFKVADLSYDGKVIPEVSAKVQVDNVGGKIEPLVISLPKNTIVLNGFFPFPEGGKPGELDITVGIASGPLEFLPAYFPDYFNKVKGFVQADLKIFGNIRTPLISGDARMVAGEFGLKGMPQPLRNVEVNLTTKDGVVSFSPVKATFGKGLLQGTGTLNIRDGIGSLTANISGNNLDFSMSGLEFHKGKATLNATGTLYNPVIRGSLIIPNGKFQISEKIFKTRTSSMSLPLESLDYAFDIEIPRNFWVRNSFVNAEMKGKVKLGGDLQSFHIEGGLETLRGWLFFQRRKFSISTGEIKFGKQDGTIDPFINFKSVTSIQSIQVFLTIQGHLSSFTPRLYSSPPMSEGDLIAMLALGMSKTDALAADPKALFENQILNGLKNTYLSGLLGSSISNVLHLDEFFMGSAFDKTQGAQRSFVHIGKYIGHNIFIAYEGTLTRSDTPRTFIIEYKLPKGLLVNFEVERPTNKNRIGLKYDWQF